MMMKQDRKGVADVLVSPRFAAWFATSPVAAPRRAGSMLGSDILALGLLGGSTLVLPSAPSEEFELPFARPEAAKGRAADDDDEDEDEDDDEDDDEDEDDLDEDEEDDDDLDDDEDEDDDDDDDDDDDEDEDDEDFLDDDEDDDYDDDEDEDFAGDDE